ncbi:hypothetical protein SETIT_6G232100v2 [Setaria italica]|uniref:Uncharacterized protein n=1 Tax=Setaria italica TaxID=4555 RepID=A0A368RPY9_SETIT|nr:hypothetical protein SETIT_6G232100v2 [Setaria italica]
MANEGAPSVKAPFLCPSCPDAATTPPSPFLCLPRHRRLPIQSAPPPLLPSCVLASTPAKHCRTNREPVPPMEPILSFLVSLLLSGWSKIREARKLREASSPVSMEKRKLLHLFVSYDELVDHLKLVDTLNMNADLPVCSTVELVQCARALKADNTLWKFVHAKRREHVVGWVIPDELLPDRGTDRAVFFQVCLKDLQVKYGDGGGDLVENIRNNGQHLVEENVLKELAPPASGYTVLFKYFQVMHIFCHHYPRVFCQFFLGMHAQGCVPSSSSKNLSHIIKQYQ